MSRVVPVVLVLASLAGACQESIKTPFPPGLEPLEDNQVPDATGAPTEMMRWKATSKDMIRIYARGFVLAPPAKVWQAALAPDAMIASCSTDQQSITLDNEPQYERSYLVHYTVNNIVTVEWDDQFRYGIIEGTVEMPMLGMVRHQKVIGSDYITLSEGTIQVLATDDPAITELAFVEHLDATAASAGDVLRGVQHNYDALVARSHDASLPACQ